MLLCGIVGVTMAFLLKRFHFRGRRLIEAIILVPAALPPLIGAVSFQFLHAGQFLLGRLHHDITDPEDALPERLLRDDVADAEDLHIIAHLGQKAAFDDDAFRRHGDALPAEKGQAKQQHGRKHRLRPHAGAPVRQRQRAGVVERAAAPSGVLVARRSPPL